MKNKITRISPERKQELKELIEQIRQEAYQEGYEDGQASPSIVEDQIEHEGKLHRKVNREAREGDVVIFQRSNEHFKSDKPYPVESDVKFKDEDGDYQNVYNSFNRRENYVNVYELIKQELSANQQRAELIEMAKVFVEVHKNKDGDVRHRLGWFTPEFYRKKNRVTCVLKCYDTNRVYGVGRANCMPGDVFNGQIGEAISLAKAVEEDIPVEFLEAVQPSEVVVGHKVRGNYAKETYEVPSFHSREHLGGMYGRSLAIEGINSRDWVGEKQVKIIDDTNAQYEVGE